MPKNFSCPACGGSIKINALGHSITALCNFCSSVIDVTDPNFRIIERDFVASEKILIEIGTRGKIDEIEWEVIGFTRKTDSTGEYHWEEYLLYNPYQGFRFLVQSNGHWSFVKVLRQEIPGAGERSKISLDNRVYKVFVNGETVVNYVKGEFYWRVKKGERTQVTDYISPPYMLSVEKNHQEINFSIGVYLEPEEIAEAFRLDELPSKEGVGANQPNTRGTNLSTTWIITLAAICIAIFIQVLFVSTAANENVYSSKETVTIFQKDMAMSTPIFRLSQSGNLVLKTISSLSNDWAEYDFTLINNNTNDQYLAKHASEYYFGSSCSGGWKKGSQSATTTFRNIPAGDYRLIYEAYAGALEKNQQLLFQLFLNYDTPIYSNFVFAVILILLPPILRSLYYLNFENTRWAEADFTPPTIAMINTIKETPGFIRETGLFKSRLQRVEEDLGIADDDY